MPVSQSADPVRYYTRIAAAFVRGRGRQEDSFSLDADLRDKPLDDLNADDIARILATGEAAGLKLHKFKRTMALPRVQRVFGVLRALSPTELLDVGSGRGVFLWPLLDEFAHLPVTAIDKDSRRATDLRAVRLGGVDRLAAHHMDITELSFEAGSFDVVTMLEVLEHLPQPQQALAETVRVARRFVVLSVPSKPDDNPQHIHLFSEANLRDLFRELKIERVSIDYVRGHIVAVANVGG